MSDLRQRAIEAAAAAVWNELPRYELMYPECERTVRVVLDALLDYLEANAAVPMYRASALSRSWAVCDPEDADVLVVDIAALREDR